MLEVLTRTYYATIITTTTLKNMQYTILSFK